MQTQPSDSDSAHSESRAPSSEDLLAELERLNRQGVQIYNSGDTTVRILAALLTYQAFAPFWSAFTGELGKQLGETTSQVMHRIRIGRTGTRATVEVRGRGVGATNSADVEPTSRLLQLEFDPDELTEEARVAMLDIDLTSPHLQNKVLRWSAQAGAWIPVPPPHQASDQ